MISKTEFTVDEIAKAFHIPALWIRHWIRRGKLEGYLLGGVLEDRVEAEALVDFQERNPRYQRAVMRLLKKNNIPHIRILRPGSSAMLSLKEDWREAYDLRKELQMRYDILTEYEGILEQKYYPHPELKTVRMEMGELEAALKDLDLNVVVRGGRVCRKG